MSEFAVNAKFTTEHRWTGHNLDVISYLPPAFVHNLLGDWLRGRPCSGTLFRASSGPFVYLHPGGHPLRGHQLTQLLRQDDIESQVAGKDESFAVLVPRVWGLYDSSPHRYGVCKWGIPMAATSWWFTDSPDFLGVPHVTFRHTLIW